MVEASFSCWIIKEKSLLLIGVKRKRMLVSERRTPLVCQIDADFERFTLWIVSDENAPGRKFVEGWVRLTGLGE